MTCPSCGEASPSGARFCPECGYGLAQRPDERRLVTVLMADIVGFTSMAETADPETVKNLVARCFESLVADIASFGGHLDKIVGDQIVAQFGAPIAHEDDAERAVRAAFKMRESLDEVAIATDQRFALRIGVNTGEVLVGAMRAGDGATVMGDVVNTASRLQTSAKPGEILVGPATYHATQSAVQYTALGPLAVKGREETVEAWSAIATTLPPGRRRRGARRAPLIGREPEMGTLRHAFFMSATRHRAQVVLMLGDAGVGKSRIASELSSELQIDQNALVLRAQCAPYGESNVWAPIASALRQALHIDHDGPLTAMRTEIAAKLRKVPNSAEDAEIERVTDGILFMTDGFMKAGVDRKRARDDAIRSVATFFEVVASKAPLVLVVSDIHWADDIVIDAIERILRRLRSLPFLLLATARPEFEQRWTPPAGHHNSLVLHLDPLDSIATAELATELFGEELDEDLLAFFLERSGGNPFFIEELVALACDVDPETHNGVAGHDRLRALPATLHGLVAARLDALAFEQRSLLEDFAVIGPHGPTATALLLSGLPDGDRVLRALQDHDLIVIDDDEFYFKSEIVREVAYSTLTKTERARRHSSLADQLERGLGETTDRDSLIDQIAHHAACAAELVAEVGYAPGVPANIQQRAIDALERAALRADDAESFIEAGRFWDRILDLCGSDPEHTRWSALLGRSRARDAFRQLDLARDDALIVHEEAKELGDQLFAARALLALGRVEGDAGNYAEADAYFSQAMTEMRALDDASGVADALRGLGVIRLFQGELNEAERLSSDALASFVSTGNRRGEAWAQQTLAWIAFSRGSTSDAEARLHRSAEVFGEIGDWGGVSWAMGLLAFVRFNQGNLDEAERLAHDIIIEASETGNVWAEGMMNILLSSIATWRGRAEEAVQRGRTAMAMFQRINDYWALSLASGPVARALATLGRFAESDVVIADIVKLAEDHADRNPPMIGSLVRTAILVERGEGDKALAISAPQAATTSSVDQVADTDRLIALALAHVQVGEAQRAVELLEGAFAAAEGDGPRAGLGGVLTLAYASSGNSEQALAVATQLSNIRGGTYMDRILMHWGCAVAFARQGASSDAVSALDEAHNLAFGTDSRLVRAISSLARACIFEQLHVPAAAEAINEASLALHALGIDGRGWRTAFSALATG